VVSSVERDGKRPPRRAWKAEEEIGPLSTQHTAESRRRVPTCTSAGKSPEGFPQVGARDGGII